MGIILRIILRDHHTAEERIGSTIKQSGSLPYTGRDHGSEDLSPLKMRTEDDVFTSAVRIDEHLFCRVTSVEVPDLLGSQSVKG